MQMVYDDRAIQAVILPNQEYWRVGEDGVTKIEAYPEPGQMAGVPWLAIYKSEILTCRINSAAVVCLIYV